LAEIFILSDRFPGTINFHISILIFQSCNPIWDLNRCFSLPSTKFNFLGLNLGARGSVVVKALCYQPEGRWFNTRWGQFLNWPNPSSRTRPQGFTQPLTEMSTRNIKIIMFLGSEVQPVRRADNLTTINEPIVQTMWDP
jgi:hypothetical protein